MFFVFKFFHDVAFFSWDASCAVINLVVPKRPEGKVTPKGHLGFRGQWPEFIPPKEGDSRCCCPALNAMANHGIIARDGKNLNFGHVDKLVRATWNFSESFCYFTGHYAAKTLSKNYDNDTFDLADLNLHNGIEHDASLFREDTALCPDQSKIPVEYIKELLASASGKDKDGNPLLTINDISKFSSKRRVDARESNPEFTLDSIHRTFGSSNASTLLTIFGGRVNDLETILLEERIPDGWESRVRRPLGLTMAQLNIAYSWWIEHRINEKKYKEERAAAQTEAAATNEANEAGGNVNSIHKDDSPV